MKIVLPLYCTFFPYRITVLIFYFTILILGGMSLHPYCMTLLAEEMSNDSVHELWIVKENKKTVMSKARYRPPIMGEYIKLREEPRKTVCFAFVIFQHVFWMTCWHCVSSTSHDHIRGTKGKTEKQPDRGFVHNRTSCNNQLKVYLA